MTNKNWVENDTADNIVVKVQENIRSGVTDSSSMQIFLDLVSGVEGYSTLNKTRQGIIKRVLDKENVKYRHGRGGNSVNFSIDIDDVVSTFWESVFKYLDRASTTGSSVSVRIVEGQEAEESVVSKDGLNFSSRNTKCNPIHYLRKMGTMGVRNLINASYRKNLMQICEDCGNSSAATKAEVSPTRCEGCGSKNTSNHWPDGNSSYKTKKQKLCGDCGSIWTRKFAYVCAHCKSSNVRIEAIHEPVDSMLDQMVSEAPRIDDEVADAQILPEIERLVGLIYEYLPKDPQDPNRVSRTKEIFNILVPSKMGVLDASTSRDICRLCALNAPKVCESKCNKGNCIHQIVPDPNVCCGASTFSLSKCVNFSKKIGEYYSCSASLSARRIKNIRKYFVRFVRSNRQIDVCDTLYSLLESRGLLSEY